ncbi:DUF2339 domain-containing protein [Tardiphaga alba]|uniref:DUF2339 domain-containing protein n=1 Tax=Tardiphaga alba TaxID=340268 RepID=A0ABX8AH32_9BRAD|nr:DUF2339 domain-containing protein [Tardiphaga alba]QUS41680.1 DUF2339 domain-containing protein [Tardiphaga alba]
MFDFDFIALVVAIVAFFFARKARNEVRILRARLDALEGAPPVVATTWSATDTPPLAPRQPTAAPVTPPPSTSPSPSSPQQPSPPPVAAPAIPAVASTPRVTETVKKPETPLPAAPRPSFEERIGTRWVVWVGGLTLALGGLFMVRYSIEAGLLGPEVRVLLGGLFALALLAVGEFARRKESLSSIAPLPIANIPAILTAAGTAVAFATIYAAYALYDFLVPGTAFVLLGIVAMATMAAALLHGPALAGLGLVGAFVTPMLVSSGKPDYWALYIYLAFVSAAAFALARMRMWRWLVLTTIAFTTFWTLPGLESGPAMIAPHVFHVIACFVLASLMVVCGFMYGPTAEPGRIEGISSAALGTSLFGATMIVLASRHADLAMIAFALLVAGTLFVAWYAQAATAAVAAAAGFVAAVFLLWAIQGNPDLLVLPGGPLPGIGMSPIEGSVTTHLVSAAVFGLGFGILGFLAQGRAVSAIIPVIWAACATFVPIALLIALYARIAHLDRSIPFAILAVVIAAGFAAATELLSKREQRPGLAISTALFATGALGAMALALTFALEKGWLTIALALMTLGTAWISMQRPIPFLRWLAAILAAIVCARMADEPRVVGDLVGTTPIFNWLLWGYGVPAASFWGAAVLMRRRGDDAPLRMVESAAILFTVLLVFLEIRHYVNGGDVYRFNSDLVEIALQVCSALAMAIGLERLRIRSGSVIHNAGALLLTLYSGLATLGGLLFIANPNIWRIDVGGPVFNLLLLGYALPAVLTLLLSYAVAGRRKPAYANTIAAGALLLALTYVTFEIRRIYHGPVFSNARVLDAEQYTLSVAWLVFGVVLLAAGLIFSSQRARLASAVVIGLTVLKAFLVDMSSLTGVWRALSFMCLGLVLVAIGYLYQRILFSRRKTQATPVEETQ